MMERCGNVEVELVYYVLLLCMFWVVLFIVKGGLLEYGYCVMLMVL